MDFAVPADNRVKLKESEKNDKHLDFTKELTNGGHPIYCIIEIGQNTENSLGDLRRLAVIQVLVKDHQLTLMWKTLKE